MIGVSIAALSVMMHASVAVSSTTPTVAHEVITAATVPSVKLPHVPMPKLRLPKLPKRNDASEPLSRTARRLKALVADEESFYSDNGRYGLDPFRVARNLTRADSTFEKVQVQILFANSKGWSAMASHPDAPGKSCVIYVGFRTSLPVIPRTRADASEAAAEGQPVCDK